MPSNDYPIWTKDSAISIYVLTIFRAQSLQHAQGLSSQISSNIFPDLPSTKKHLSLKRFCTLHVDEWLICCVTLGNRCKCWNNLSYRNINNLDHLESRFSSPSKLASTLCPFWCPLDFPGTPSAGDPWPWFAPSVIRIPTEVCRVCFGRWKVTGRSWMFKMFEPLWYTMVKAFLRSISQPDRFENIFLWNGMKVNPWNQEVHF